ncbi:MAG: chemotaxis protein CheB [Bacteroidetes bacterium]|nr:chemotaxis protein CheB [Bacteroidota bacterium]
MQPFKYTIVIGTSAGGLKVLGELLKDLKADMNAAVFVVLHLSKKSNVDVLQEILQRGSLLPVKEARHGEEIKRGHVYLAPVDEHLFVKKDTIVLTKRPTENRWRPAIDVLFRSAAEAYGSRVIGIILSGLLNDGTSGMHAIKKAGGVTIVQEPGEAEFEDMPNNVIKNVQVDYRVSVSDMPFILQDVLSREPGPNQELQEGTDFINSND